MIKLVIGNSVCRFSDLPIEHYRAIKKLLSYKDKSKRIEKILKDKATGKPLINKETGKPRTFIVYPLISLLEKSGEFPTGLLYLVKEYIKAIKTPVIVLDERKRPAIHQFGGGQPIAYLFPFEPYPEQFEGATAAVKYGRGIETAPTGVGKSAIAALIIASLQISTLIVVPSVELKNQLTDSLKDIFGIDMVGPLNKGKKQFNITIENIGQLDPKIKAEGFDCLIIDEFHHSGAVSYRELNKQSWGNIYFRFGLTATPFRSDDNEKLLLESVLSNVIYKIDYATAVKKGYIVPVEFYYVDLPKVKCSSKKWQGVYKELVVNRKDKNKIICDFMESLHISDIPTITLVKQVEHGKLLKDEMLSRNLEIQFANGKDGSNKQLIRAFNNRMLTVLIGTSGVIGEGIDTKPCEYVILAGGGKSKNQFMQMVGRGFRRFGNKQSCKVIMFRDPSHKWMLQHFNECVKYIKEEYGAKPSKLEI